MKKFSMSDDNTLLCDTARCRAQVQRLAGGEQLMLAAQPAVEVVFCVIEGSLQVETDSAHGLLNAMQGVQLPAGQAWRAVTGAAGAKLLRVDSFHPKLSAGDRLMPALTHPHYFNVLESEMLVYTDYVRGGVLNFAPGFAADKHFHQDADEIFWFFAGICRVVTPDGEVLAPAGSIVYTAPGEWHIIENADDKPLRMFLTVTPNLVPSHTFFLPDGTPHVRSWEPLRRP
jgi:mannose-6-phosphate isomerase-like protein (cupin superfamily)